MSFWRDTNDIYRSSPRLPEWRLTTSGISQIKCRFSSLCQSWPPEALLAAFRVLWSHLPLHMSHVPDVSQACRELISFFYRASCNVHFPPVPQKLVQCLCSLPMAAATNCREFGGLKWQNFLLPRFRRPELKSRCRQGCAPSKGFRGEPFLTTLGFWRLCAFLCLRLQVAFCSVCLRLFCFLWGSISLDLGTSQEIQNDRISRLIYQLKTAT